MSSDPRTRMNSEHDPTRVKASSHQPKRVFVIGLDGATFDLLEPMMDDGLLPHLSDLVSSGTTGRLHSTTPPTSPSAWTTFFTGMNPGKHGVFGFQMPLSARFKRGLVDSQTIATSKLWHYIGRAGRTVGLVNVPMTYPVEPVPGFMVAGMLTPDTDRVFTHPPSLSREIKEALGEYIIDVAVGPNSDPLAALQRVHRAAAIRMEAIEYLLNRYKIPDLFVAVFVAMDRIQHLFWKYLDPREPMYETETAASLRRQVCSCYTQLDSFIGRIRTRLGRDSLLILMSDHGFGPLHGWFYGNIWLARKGLLELKPSAAAKTWLLRRLNVPLMGKAMRHMPRYGLRRIKPNSLAMINWSSTRAYCAAATDQGIYINVHGREPFGIVHEGSEYEGVCDRLCEELKRLTHPVSGAPLVDQVWRREELYAGPIQEGAPDLIVKMQEYAVLVNESLIRDESFLSLSDKPVGSHRLDGVLVLKGPTIKQGHTLSGARIMDLAPTILYAMGLRVPEDMDGCVLLDSFDPEYAAMHPPEYAPAGGYLGSVDGDGEGHAYDDSDAETIKERLRGLGYLE